MADDLALAAVAAEARRVIPKMVRMLLAARAEPAKDLAGAMGMSEASLSDRLRGKTRFTADEVATIAAHFGVPVTTLYQAPEWASELTASSASDWLLPHLAPRSVALEPV